MAIGTRLPMGIENFREMRRQKYYYVDKTGLIREFLENFAKVNLFTRPRRFGKNLNMSMLKYFFETGSDIAPFDNHALFDGLEISQEKELCAEYMGKFPVISITLKGATGQNFEEAKGMLRSIIGNEAMRQIRSRRYEETLVRDGMQTIYRYGIACYRKRCRVVSERVEL